MKKVNVTNTSDSQRDLCNGVKTQHPTAEQRKPTILQSFTNFLTMRPRSEAEETLTVIQDNGKVSFELNNPILTDKQSLVNFVHNYEEITVSPSREDNFQHEPSKKPENSSSKFGAILKLLSPTSTPRNPTTFTDLSNDDTEEFIQQTPTTKNRHKKKRRSHPNCAFLPNYSFGSVKKQVSFTTHYVHRKQKRHKFKEGIDYQSARIKSYAHLAAGRSFDCSSPIRPPRQPRMFGSTCSLDKTPESMEMYSSLPCTPTKRKTLPSPGPVTSPPSGVDSFSSFRNLSSKELFKKRQSFRRAQTVCHGSLASPPSVSPTKRIISPLPISEEEEEVKVQPSQEDTLEQQHYNCREQNWFTRAWIELSDLTVQGAIQYKPLLLQEETSIEVLQVHDEIVGSLDGNSTCSSTLSVAQSDVLPLTGCAGEGKAILQLIHLCSTKPARSYSNDMTDYFNKHSDSLKLKGILWYRYLSR